VKKHRKDLRQFLRQVLHPGDQAFLVSVPSLALLTVDLTNSTSELDSAVKDLDGQHMRGRILGGACPGVSARVYMGTNCGTLLWNGVWGSARLRLRNVEGRKAILVLSDGQDTGSEHTLSAAIEAAQGADAPVYTIGSEPSATIAFFTPALRSRNSMGLSYLQHLSDETGGAYFKAARNPEKIFSQIEGELRHLYVLSFALPEAERDGKYHKLEVQSSREGVRLRARAGYIAEF
jgi:VWFA-related protein